MSVCTKHPRITVTWTPWEYRPGQFTTCPVCQESGSIVATDNAETILLELADEGVPFGLNGRTYERDGSAWVAVGYLGRGDTRVEVRDSA